MPGRGSGRGENGGDVRGKDTAFVTGSGLLFDG
jgi:hypothetical protein